MIKSIGKLIKGIYLASAPALSDKQEYPLTLDSTGKLRVTGGGNATETTTTGTVTSAAGASSYVVGAVSGAPGISFQLLGTWTATLIFEVSNDGGTTYYQVDAYDVGNDKLVASPTANGLYLLLVEGCSHARVRATAYTSGTVNVTAFGGAGVPTARYAGNLRAAGATTALRSALMGVTDGTNQRAARGLADGTLAVAEQGPATAAYAQVSIPTTVGGTLIKASNATRRSIVITNDGTQLIYVGANGLAAATGKSLVAGASITLTSQAAIYGLSSSGTQNVSYAEESD